ncbi:ECF transporter S component [Mycoplasma sp. SG1]|uniref:ECF transporter S component n=1 Tax=Mycoplasma sp. SG1 TaxID=2810348 RepID=UPI002024D7E3|nr:ECF transporter S component [Mycoplasma sp. SG1]URM52874.1 hypothetical protein JRW51_00820 [Mycoplasma sp. SG1]
MEYFYWFIILFGALIVVFLLEHYIFKINTFKPLNKIIISRIAHCGLFIAVAIILQLLSNSVFAFSRYLQFPLSNIPLAYTGFLFGPFYGFLSGIIYDCLNTLFGVINGAYHPGFTFVSGCYGLIPGFLVLLIVKFYKFFHKYGFFIIWGLILAVLTWIIIYTILNQNTLADKLSLSKTVFFSIYFSVIFIFYSVVLILFIYNFKKNNIRNINLFHLIFLTFFFEMIFVSFFLTPILLKQIYGVPVSVWLLVRITISPLTFGLVALFTVLITYRLKNVITADKMLYYVMNPKVKILNTSTMNDNNIKQKNTQ